MSQSLDQQISNEISDDVQGKLRVRSARIVKGPPAEEPEEATPPSKKSSPGNRATTPQLAKAARTQSPAVDEVEFDESPQPQPSQRRSSAGGGRRKSITVVDNVVMTVPDYVPSDSLMKVTAARLHDGLVLERRRSVKASEDIHALITTTLLDQQAQQEASGSAATTTPKKTPPPSNYAPSESLMKATQNRIMDVVELAARKDRINPEDDPWWELRHPDNPAQYKRHIEVQSKLAQPTAAALNAQRDKHSKKAAEEAAEHSHASTAKIDVSSPLLKPTQAVLRAAWGSDTPAAHPGGDVTGPTMLTQSYRPVESRLRKETVSVAQARWRSPEQVAQDEQAQQAAARAAVSPVRKVREASERLRTFNAAMRHQVRAKVVKEGGDPREAKWSAHFTKEGIPDLAEMPKSPSPGRRRHSGGNGASPASSPHGTTTNGSTSADADAGEHVFGAAVSAAEELQSF